MTSLIDTVGENDRQAHAAIGGAMTVQSLNASRLTKALLPNAGSPRFDFRRLAFDPSICVICGFFDQV
jgi:hypothetical protein